MQTATNMFGSESANFGTESELRGLKLIGVICPFIDLFSLYNMLDIFDFEQKRIITRPTTVRKWREAIDEGEENDFSLDWITSLEREENPDYRGIENTPEWIKYIYVLEGNINGDDFSIEIHTWSSDYDIHTKLYFFDRGFVITSGNLTSWGTLQRHLELGVLVTEYDNQIENKVIRRHFENCWHYGGRSCLGFRKEIKLKFAKGLLDSVLREEIENNEANNGPVDYYFSWRLFCFGCDEGRGGDIITSGKEISGNSYDEILCENCSRILEKIRKFMPPVVQEISHEGAILWRIPRKFYELHNTFLYKFYDDFRNHDSETVVLFASDDGSLDRLIVNLIAANIETGYVCLSCGNNVKNDFQLCPYCGAEFPENYFELHEEVDISNFW